jgi:putative ABC transport system permease protein
MRSPGVALTLLLTIALGIGSNAAIAGFVRGLVTYDLPIQDIDQIVSVFARDAEDAFGPLAYGTYRSIRSQSDAFERLGAARQTRRSIMVGDRSAVMSVASVTPELADLLQIAPGPGIVVSHRVWQDEFGGKTEVRGARARVDDLEYQVTGVAPEWLEGVYFGSAVDIWMLLGEEAVHGSDARSRTFWVLGRLSPGVSPVRAQGIVNGARSETDLIAVLPYTGLTPDVSGGMLRIRMLLFAAAGAVFLIACANMATFLLSRASSRARETSVRVALGASRYQLTRQLLCDAVVISVAGGAIGLLLAVWTSNIVPAFLFDKDAEQLVFVPDLLGTIVVAIACAGVMAVCGLTPLFELRHDDPARVLRRESAGPSVAMRRLRAGLVVGQMTCCCLLVVSAATLLTGFRHALQTEAGGQLKESILATLEARGRFSRPDLGLQYFRDSEQAAHALPGIATAAWTGTAPGSRPGWMSYRFVPAQLPARDLDMDVVAFTPQTLPLITVPPIAGRMFGGGDSPASCRVVVVNEAASRRVFDDDAVGRRIEDPSGQRAEIVGVVAASPAAGEARRTAPTVYYYAAQTEPPVTRGSTGRFGISIRPTLAHGVLEANVVSRSYFDLMGLSAVEGRLFSDEERGCRVGVINHEANELYFGGHGVGGAVIDPASNRTGIVGVVHSSLLRASQRRVEPAIYLPMAQDYVPLMTLILGAREANDATLASVRKALDEVPGGERPAVVRTLEEHLARTAFASERIAMVLVTTSAATALVLGVLGLYGAMTEAARQRRREFGVRIALGARGWRLIREILSEGLRLAAAGTIAGLLGSLLVARSLAGVAPSGGSPTLWAWLSAPLTLLIAVVMASVLPARRALATDPLIVMRDE